MNKSGRLFLSAILALSVLVGAAGSWAMIPAEKSRAAANDLVRVQKEEIQVMEAAMAEKIYTFDTREAFVDDQTDVRFPKQIGDLHIVQVDDLRPVASALGRGLHYRYPQVKATIYVYNAGKSTIRAGITDPGIRDEIIGAIREVYGQGELGYYLDIKALNPQSSDFKTTTGNQDVLWTKFTYTEIEKGIQVDKMSWLFITAYKNYFFKIRYTSEASLFDDDMPGEHLFGDFMVDIGHLFD